MQGLGFGLPVQGLRLQEMRPFCNRPEALRILDLAVTVQGPASRIVGVVTMGKTH